MTLTYCLPNERRRRASIWDMNLSGRRLNWRLLAALSVNCAIWAVVARLATV